MGAHTTKRKNRWFRAKTFGWGWVPITWQGWLITALYTFLFTLFTIVFMGWLGVAKESGAGTRAVLLGAAEYLVAVALLSYILYRICRRYGDKPRWRWGEDT